MSELVKLINVGPLDIFHGNSDRKEDAYEVSSLEMAYRLENISSTLYHVDASEVCHDRKVRSDIPF